jgi:hypothetical protein
MLKTRFMMFLFTEMEASAFVALNIKPGKADVTKNLWLNAELEG